MGRVAAAAVGLHIRKDASGHHEGEKVDGDKESSYYSEKNEKRSRGGLVVLQLHEGHLNSFFLPMRHKETIAKPARSADVRLLAFS